MKNGRDVWIAESLVSYDTTIAAVEGEMNEKVDSGWTMSREIFSENARKVFDIAINHRRLELKPPNDAMKGVRFHDDRAILARLESQCTEEEFMSCPGMRIDHALVDAAQSDYWYEYEKKYDCESYFSDETETADEEDGE